MVQGGTSTGRGVRDNCEITAKVPEALLTVSRRHGSRSSCHVAEPWLTQVRGLATYVVPKIDVQLSASFQFKPGTLGLGGNDSATNGTLGHRQLRRDQRGRWRRPLLERPAVGEPAAAR